jgi:NADPH:quinone reductase-like Zn-dependent oxidoreductase
MHFMKDVFTDKKQKILIYGASGAIGTFAVQFASYMGAEVTGVCSSGNVEMVKSLGASKVIDYTRKEAVKQLEEYDLIFDAVGKDKSSEVKKQCKGTLSSGRKYVSVDDGFLKVEPGYLKKLNDLIENESLEPVIDKIFHLAKTKEAHEYVDLGHKKGNVVINVSE